MKVVNNYKQGKFKAIIIVVTINNVHPDHLLFGHLTPKLLIEELQQLAKFSGKKSLKNFPIVITHIKPDADNITQIKKELHEGNTLGVQYIFPEQGEPLEF